MLIRYRDVRTDRHPSREDGTLSSCQRNEALYKKGTVKLPFFFSSLYQHFKSAGENNGSPATDDRFIRTLIARFATAVGFYRPREIIHLDLGKGCT